jgi:hypothetical protein
MTSNGLDLPSARQEGFNFKSLPPKDGHYIFTKMKFSSKN